MRLQAGASRVLAGKRLMLPTDAGKTSRMQADIESQPDSPTLDLERYEALLQLADVIASRLGLRELFHELAVRVQKVANCSLLSFILHDPKKNVMRIEVWEGVTIPELPKEMRIENSASGWVWQHQTPMIIPDLQAETKYPIIFNALRKAGVRSYCMLPMTAGERKLGAFGVGAEHPNAYDESDVAFLRRVAELIALAADNSLAQRALVEEKERLRALVGVNRTLASSLEMRRLLPLISGCVTRVVPHDFAGITLFDDDRKDMRVYILSSPETGTVVEPERSVAAKETLAIRAILAGKSQTFTRKDLVELNTPVSHHVLETGLNTVHCVPLMTAKGTFGTLNIGSKQDNAFSLQDHELLNQVAAQLAIALENAQAYREITDLKNRLEEEKLYLESEIQTELHFEEIVGKSEVLRHVLGQVSTVAASPATVLILGETGTGKELIARAIHKLSRRRNNSFIKLNCAAIPTGLLESELFGHEKGAFTGAISQKVGRLELAHGGTLFLDEIGDIPLEIQPKLLRVLQDQEFERLGSTRTIRVDIRLLAATNRNLTTAVAEGEFRRDLFYRISVFPVRLPALRDRAEDIPQLVHHFVRKFSKRMDKTIETIPNDAMTAFRRWNWPGNVRELENFIERSVILTEGTVLHAPLAELRSQVENEDQGNDTTLHAAEREHILKVLRESHGVISGPRGAASRLGLKRTTLQYKMQKLGIVREAYLK
jgi:formate hydrogenlyase transcriptional activator